MTDPLGLSADPTGRLPDLNLMPHDPEPCRSCVLTCPAGTLRIPVDSVAAGVVPSSDFSYPPVSGNARSGRDPV